MEQKESPIIEETEFAGDNAEVVTVVSVKIAPEADSAVAALAEEVSHLLQYARDRKVESLIDVKAATEDLSIISSLKKSLKTKKEEYTRPLDALKKTVLETFQRIVTPLDEADRLTREGILAFQSEQRRQVEEQAAIARQEQELAERKAALNGTPPPEPTTVIIPDPPKTMHGELGTASQKANWKWEVTDFAAVPDEYKMIDAGVLTPVVKASKGKVPIPGIKQYNEPILGVTTKRGEES